MVDIKLYSTPSCPFCAMARNFFKGADVEFEDVDVSKDQDAAMEMVKKSGKMLLPQIEIGDTIIVGFDEKAIKQELGIDVSSSHNRGRTSRAYSSNLFKNNAKELELE